MNKHDLISTEHTRRFVYEGKIPIESLRAEELAHAANKEKENKDATQRGVESFQNLLREKGISLKDFLSLQKLWGDTIEASRTMMLQEEIQSQE